MKRMMMAAMVAAMLLGSVGALMAAELKVAVLDSQEVINKTNAAKRAVDRLKQSRESAQTQISKLEAPLVEKQKKLAEQQKVMAPDKFAAEQESFQKDVMALQGKTESIRVNLEKEGLTLRKQIADAVKDVVAAIAKERGYDVVFPKAMAIYSGANVPDITAEVLTKVNAKLDK